MYYLCFRAKPVIFLDHVSQHLALTLVVQTCSIYQRFGFGPVRRTTLIHYEILKRKLQKAARTLKTHNKYRGTIIAVFQQFSNINIQGASNESEGAT